MYNACLRSFCVRRSDGAQVWWRAIVVCGVCWLLRTSSSVTSLAVDKNRVLLRREWRGNDEEDENSGDYVNASHVHVSRSCDVITASKATCSIP